MLAYSIDWSPTQIQWIIDGTVVRTVLASAAGGAYPQTPSQIRIGTWCGGCAGEPAGTVTWAGGATTFDGAPYVMTVQSLTVVNANPASSYTYSDLSGSAASIKGSNAAVSVSGSSSVASSSSASASVKSSASSKSSATASAPDSPSEPSGSAAASGSGSGSKATGTGSGAGSKTTGAAGPTINSLPSSSSSHRLSPGSIMALVFGAIILVA